MAVQSQQSIRFTWKHRNDGASVTFLLRMMETMMKVH